MTAFAAMRQTLVADPNLGLDAVYTPPTSPGGSAIALRVLVRDEDDVVSDLLTSKAVARRVVAEASAADLTSPIEGGTLQLVATGETFTIAIPRYTDDRRGWILPLRKA